jgi:hypothetical protein
LLSINIEFYRQSKFPTIIKIEKISVDKLDIDIFNGDGVCQASCRINTSLHILDITDLPLTLSLCQHGSGL